MRKLTTGDLFTLSEILDKADIPFVGVDGGAIISGAVKSIHKAKPELIAFVEDVMEIKDFEKLSLKESAAVLKKFQAENGKDVSDFFQELMAGE